MALFPLLLYACTINFVLPDEHNVFGLSCHQHGQSQRFTGGLRRKTAHRRHSTANTIRSAQGCAQGRESYWILPPDPRRQAFAASCPGCSCERGLASPALPATNGFACNAFIQSIPGCSCTRAPRARRLKDLSLSSSSPSMFPLPCSVCPVCSVCAVGSVCLSACLPACLSPGVSVTVCLLACPSVCLFAFRTCLFCLSACLHVCLYVCTSVRLALHFVRLGSLQVASAVRELLSNCEGDIGLETDSAGNTFECFSERGFTYRGLAHTTIDGDECIPWKDTDYYVRLLLPAVGLCPPYLNLLTSPSPSLTMTSMSCLVLASGVHALVYSRLRLCIASAPKLLKVVLVCVSGMDES